MAKRRRSPRAINRGAPVVVTGAEEMAAALRDAGVETRKQVRAANQRIGKKVEGWAKTEARRGSRMQAKAAPAILGGSTNEYAFVRITRDRKIPFALAAFWGVIGRRGWYAAQRYRGSGAPQFPRWVGNSGWQWGGPGGPYAVNDALRKKADEIRDEYLDAIETAFADSGLDLEG